MMRNKTDRENRIFLLTPFYSTISAAEHVLMDE